MPTDEELLEKDGALFGRLLGHIELLRSMEPTFGHATALMKYGRKFLPSRKKHDWLVMGPKRACFNNATPYAVARNDVFYAEGYAIKPDLPIPLQHAWLVDCSGHVIDPTWGETLGHVYLGVAFKGEFVAETLRQNNGQAGILVNMHLLLQHHMTGKALESAIKRGLLELSSS